MTPIDVPDTPSGIARVSFDIERVDFGAPEASGRQGGVQAGWPLWRASLEIDRSDPISADLWSAFFLRLRGRIGRLLVSDPTRPFPIAYRGGFAGLLRASGGAFDGAASTWAQANDGAGGQTYLSVTGLPANFQLNIADYVGLKWDRVGDPAGSFLGRTMARVSYDADIAVDGSGYVYIEPPLDLRVVPAGATLHFDRPKCVMQLVPEKSGLGPIGQGGALSNGTITAIQDLRP